MVIYLCRPELVDASRSEVLAHSELRQALLTSETAPSPRAGIVAIGERRWRWLLLLAALNGWQPQGSELRGEPGWQGVYDLAAGQLVCDADAASLRVAFKLAARLPCQPRLARTLAGFGATLGSGPERGVIEALALGFDAYGHHDLDLLIRFCVRGFRIC